MTRHTSSGQSHDGSRPPLAFLFDVDNTLLDNDAAKRRLASDLQALVGDTRARRFWELYEDLRGELGIVDIPLTIERFVAAHDFPSLRSQVASVFFDCPFRDFVFEGASAAVNHARTMGSVAIVSDGDQVFQRHKIRSSGLDDLVAGNVLVFPHKESEIPVITNAFPAERYVMIDDKKRILDAMKAATPPAVTTVFVRKGSYADSVVPSPNELTIGDIGDLAGLSLADFQS